MIFVDLMRSCHLVILDKQKFDDDENVCCTELNTIKWSHNFITKWTKAETKIYLINLK